ncbi:kinase-like protein [Aspergillus karnatakaensis]|uniref:putative serine/threonine protein kinase (Prp4) n=1 Tax=Aspergillus karnatakaensis TaxID=1810916 RepID=UPI003CCDA03C
MATRKSRSPSTASEGEIIESGSETKATTSQSPPNGTSVDRPPRDRNAPIPGSQALLADSHQYNQRPKSRSRSRSRSPHRVPRGVKRFRLEDEYEVDYGFDGGYTRRKRPGAPPDGLPDRLYIRPPQYHDFDRQISYHPTVRYGNGSARPEDLRPSSQTRSSYHEGRTRKQYGDDGLEPRREQTSDQRRRAGNQREQTDSRGEQTNRKSSTEQSVIVRGYPPAVAQESRKDAETLRNQVQEHFPGAAANGHDRVNEPSGEQEPIEPLDEAAQLEARRRRREAIKAKYQSQATPLRIQALALADRDSTPESSEAVTPNNEAPGRRDLCLQSDTVDNDFADSAGLTPNEINVDPFPEFSIGKDADLVHENAADGADKDEPSAADYDPTIDMKAEREKHVREENSEVSAASYDETKTTKQDVLLPDAPSEPETKTQAPYDMFAEDDDDMFAEETEETAQPAHASAASAVPLARELDISMMDNWDDPEGYYNLRIGELIDGRYHVKQNLGKGMFSSVVRATDSKTGNTVAIKIIRQNDTMKKAGLKEINILQQLQEADPEDKKHMIRFERSFEHKGHLCMVFENLSMNLREVLKKFGRDVGLNLRAIRAYAQQIFLGLSLMRKCNILHADLKPDNLLVNEQRNILKVCDLGSASPASDNEITPYLVSRFYRAPEIILGIPYDYAIDMWSIGCTLFELYTSKILFTGRNNNQMLKSIMECRGKYPPKLLRRGSLAHLHFDDMLNFHSTEEDKITGRLATRVMDFKKPTRDLKTRLMGKGTRGMTDSEAKELALFVDLLDRCLSLNPEKRCSPAEALKHPFISRPKG